MSKLKLIRRYENYINELHSRIDVLQQVVAVTQVKLFKTSNKKVCSQFDDVVEATNNLIDVWNNQYEYLEAKDE